MSKSPESEVQRAAYSVSQFCEAYGIGRRTFYDLLKKGKAPKVKKVGNRTLVPVAAAREWEAA